MIKKNLICFAFVFLLIVPMLSATQGSLGTFRVGENITLRQTCADCSFVNITSVVLSNVDSTEVISGQLAMTKSGTEYTYDLTSNYTTKLGNYIVNGFGDPGGTDTIFVYDFDVTYTGKVLSIASSVFYIILFVIFILLFGLTLFFIHKLPKKNDSDERGVILKINYLKYLRSVLWFVLWIFVIAMFFIASNLSFAYLEDTLFANFMFVLFRITFLITPIILILWFILHKQNGYFSDNLHFHRQFFYVMTNA